MTNIWDPVKTEIYNYILNNSYHSVETIYNLQQKLHPILSNYEFVDDQQLPYGRYLVYRDKDNKFNIQIDVFSRNYTGQIHCHKTWGIMHVFKGFLFVEDWEEKINNNFTLRGGLTLNKGSSQSFCPPISDWHKVSSGDSEEQVLSMHIYGQGFNLDKGIYLNSDLVPKVSNRSPFKDLSFINKIIKH